MSVSMLDNISYKGKKPDNVRSQFDTIAEMVAFSENYLPDMLDSFCLEDRKKYRYDKNNDIDPVLGKWREITSGSGDIPTASATVKGGVKIGDNLTMTGEVLSADVQSDENFTTELKEKLEGIDMDTKVDVVEGKGLSTNDLTDELKEQYDKAEENVQPDWNQTDDTLDDFIKNKPTNVSDFTNDSNFIDKDVELLTHFYDKDSSYNRTEVDALINAINSFNVKVVDELPTEDIDKRAIYFVPRTGTTRDVYDEYIYLEDKHEWEHIGSSTTADCSIDISKADYQALVAAGTVKTGVTYYVYDEASGGGGGDATFPEDFTTNVTVGGVASGTLIEAGTSVAEVVKNILLQYVKPTISLSINPSTTLYYYGQTISSEDLSVTVTANSGKITKVVIKRGDTVLDTTESETGVTSASYTDDTEIADTVTYTAVGTGSDNISVTKTITFCNPSFAGTVASTLTSVTADDITGLTKKFANNKKGYTYTGITMDFGKILYAYPKSFGALTSISDGTYSYTDSYTRSEVTVNINGTDVVYYAYLLTDATGVENFKQIYS